MGEISPGNYYKNFGGFYGSMIAVAGLFPFLAFFGIDQIKVSLFPPLGDSKNYYSGAILFVIFLTTFIVYFQKGWECIKSERAKAIISIICFIFIVAFLVSYIAIIQKYVVVIGSENEPIYLTKGYERKLDKEYVRTDKELIENKGIRDSDLAEIWTPESITCVRVGMFVTYMFIIISFVALFSFMVLLDLLSKKRV